MPTQGTAYAIANDLVSHSGNQIGDGQTPAGAMAYLVNVLNQSLELMRVKIPGMFRETKTVNWTGSKTGTINVTQGSTACTLGTLAPSDNGCTIVIGGDIGYNEIRASSSGGYELLVPFQGATGTMPATVWGDSVTLDCTAVDHACGASLLHDRTTLAILLSRMEWLMAQTNYRMGDYAGVIGAGASPQSAPVIRRLPGVPEAIWFYAYTSPSGVQEFQVRVAPMPSGNWSADVDLAIIPDEVNLADLESGNLRYFPVPGGRVYTIFRALALYHWSGSPFFANQAARKVIEQGYQDAVTQLENFRPNTSAQPRAIVRGYL